MLLLFLAVAVAASSWAAAPDDINQDLRAWYDAYDVNGNNDYTDNPAAGTSVSPWVDKSGNGNDVAHPTVTRRPRIKDLATNPGLEFINDRLYKQPDIWSGNVTDVDIFSASSTDATFRQSYLFSSRGIPTQMRISAHVPWSNGITYWDRGLCCSASRLFGGIGIASQTKYVWNFYAAHNLANQPFGLGQYMYVLQNGFALLVNTKISTYTSGSNSYFAIGGAAPADSTFMRGTVGEMLFYQRTLNLAERNIINSYLFSRWNVPGLLNRDKYTGDTFAQYYYHVGGTGKTGQAVVTKGTSLGLTIEAIQENNLGYLLAGLKDLTPPTGTVTTDIPSTVIDRAKRDWYIDRTPDLAAGTNKITFDLAEMEVSAADGDEIALLYRNIFTNQYSILQTGTVSGTDVSFTLSAPADGHYTIGRLTAGAPKFELQKTVALTEDPVQGDTAPKAIPGSQQLYSIRIANTGSATADPNSLVIGDTLDDSLDLFVGDLDGNGSPILFEQGVPSCELSFIFDGFTSTTDSVDFFDGSGMLLTAVNPDSDGYDANIRRIEIRPSGSFASQQAGQAPFCVFKYKTRLK